MLRLLTQSHSVGRSKDIYTSSLPWSRSPAEEVSHQMTSFLKTAAPPTSCSLASEIRSFSSLCGHGPLPGSEPPRGHLINLPAHGGPSLFHPASCRPSDPPRTVSFSKLSLQEPHHQGENQIEMSQGGI